MEFCPELCTSQSVTYLIIDSMIAEVVLNVLNETSYRPRCDALSAANYVVDVMTMSWCAPPENRPDFRTIRHKLKPMFEPIYKRNIMVCFPFGRRKHWVLFTYGQLNRRDVTVKKLFTSMTDFYTTKKAILGVI